MSNSILFSNSRELENIQKRKRAKNVLDPPQFNTLQKGTDEPILRLAQGKVLDPQLEQWVA